MGSFVIRIFATNRIMDETNGLVPQSDFTEQERKEIEVRKVMLYETTEGDIAKTPAGTYFSFEEKSLGFNIETRYIPFVEFNKYLELESFLGRRFLYLATRWIGQPTDKLYPRAIPDDNTKAIRLAIEEKSVENDEGFLYLRIKGKVKKW